jgi:hypothetical protein
MAFKTYVNASAGSTGNMAPITSPGGSGGGASGWHPTVLYMIALVVAEIAAVAWISKHL